MKLIGAAALSVYVVAIVMANWLVVHVGLIHVFPWPVAGVLLLAPAGVYCAGLTFPARDLVQRSLGRLAGVLAIILAAAISWRISSPAVAVASGVTFLVSETLDFIIYTPLQRRFFLSAVAVSSAISAVVDSLLFLYLAHIPYSIVIAGQPVSILGGQIFGKLTVIAIVGLPATAALRRALPLRPARNAA